MTVLGLPPIARHRARVRWIATGAALLLLVGCAAEGRRKIPLCVELGIRPDPPQINTPPTNCADLKNYLEFSEDLREAYRSRATQNRAWIYVAGLLGIGTAAATGGLGIAGASGTTLALTGISGGAVSSGLAVIDNSTLAAVYTKCANDINSAIVDASDDHPATGSDAATTPADETSLCQARLAQLRQRVGAAMNLLESARTNAAVAAAVRTQHELEEMQQRMDALRAQLNTTPATPATTVTPTGTNNTATATATPTVKPTP